MPSDSELSRAALAGEVSALGAVIERHHASMRAVALRTLWAIDRKPRTRFNTRWSWLWRVWGRASPNRTLYCTNGRHPAGSAVLGLILFVVVGGSFLIAAIAVFARWPRARLLALGAGALVLGWLTVQVAIIGYVSWMQPTTAVVAFVILALALQLADSNVSRRSQRGSSR